ncbi:related to nitrate assimilation regulatory protein nirA [Fusarium torulosum]|uniref:Related to nitrate assimilation regulatory protein nirA n=1 Tax=Fusarium torulosum TaxID=33205 RepID=A0AAE8M882_9HYPO|nr:related to nitrate assimilation regulatory protein nirA [Fusarium torulosum]
MTTTSIYDAMNVPHMPGVHPVAISRPQVGIERLPTRRMSNEPRESMNCKSCRKRKIKCNRLRPSCEACQVFQCPCVYDAVPKKRGPKTDVLEALLKRVDGLEAKLREKGEDDVSLATTNLPGVGKGEASESGSQATELGESVTKQLAVDVRTSPGDTASLSPHTPVARDLPPSVQAEALLDTYFARFHGKPYYIVDESSIRQRLQLNQLPKFLSFAISAVAARHNTDPSGYQAAANLSEDLAARARREINTDEPSIDGLQALLLLVSAFTATGKGKKAYMLMTSATGMAMALEIHKETDTQARMTPVEREMRRRLFWTCYLLDRFQATGSKRPSLISDNTIMLRLPSWSPNSSSLPVEGEFFQTGSNLQYFQGSDKKPQGSMGMLIDITRVLGNTNRYLAAGGVKGDSHFPWHTLSTISKIRQDLDVWATGTEEVFSNPSAMFGQADSTILLLSKVIYHLIHCLIYRPFLPIDLAELAETGQHQSWQIEATNMCFLHANAIMELIQLGKQSGIVDWPAFIGYCVCTAGTVHVHGAHYSQQGSQGEANVFSSAADFLSREMQFLSELRYAWATVQHQRETLQDISHAHGELVKALARSSMRYTPGFHSEDFFDRYSSIGGPGGPSFSFDAANLRLSDVAVDMSAGPTAGEDNVRSLDRPHRPSLKRKNTAPPGPINRRRPDVKVISSLAPSATGLPTPGTARRSFSYTAGGMPHSSPGLLATPTSLPGHHENHEMYAMHEHMNDASANNAAVAAAAAAGFTMSPTSHAVSSHPMHPMGGAPFSPPYSYGSGSSITNTGPGMINEANGGYDAMFGTVPTNAFGSPAAWHGDDNHNKMHFHQARVAATSPGGRSNNGSSGTGQGEEKDPFLALLEQLAENENRSQNGHGGDLDFFLGNSNVNH